MNLQEILLKYDTVVLDQISSDKVDEAINLRLPQPVIVQEIVSALSSQSYISDKILYSRPPTYAILNTILQSPGYLSDVEGFKARVLENTASLKESAKSNKKTQEKYPQLYIKILKKAWENDGVIDHSEAHILELVKEELGIWDREHFVLMHDESILNNWDLEHEYYVARNHLLSTGILLAVDSSYVIAEEVAVRIKKVFGIEITDNAFKRLLNTLSKEELAFALGSFNLNISGSKDQLIERLMNSLIPPTEILNTYSLESLRDVCRRNNISSSGVKNIVIANIIEFFDTDSDLKEKVIEVPQSIIPKEPELREMDPETYSRILLNLTGQQLYDVMYKNELMVSGTKEEKVKRIVESNWSERSILSQLRKEDLAQLCRKLMLHSTGAKQELVDRIIDYVPTVITNQHIPFTAGESAIDLPIAPPLPTSEISIHQEIQEQVPLPTNWDEVNEKYPELDHSEKVVLAILKDAKSITEQDIERIVAKHRLGWFLHKANMAELIAKMKRFGKKIVQIKSIQNANIYQWVGSEILDDNVLERKSARDIIDALRHGVVPNHNLAMLAVGQPTVRTHLSELLAEVAAEKSHFKFIRGQYGSGKTFLCSWLKEYALDQEYAVSFINIGHDQPLSDLPIFFSGLIAGLRTPEKVDSSALVDILESWLLNIYTKTAKIEQLSPDSPANQEKLNQIVDRTIESELANLNDIEPGFPQALRAFYEGKVSGNMELVSNAVSWITGSRSLSAQALREIGVKGNLEANNVFPRMRALLKIISGARYKGLLLLVDELELIRKFPHARQREQALETLRLLIDEAGRNALPGCLLVFTGTDEFFEDERYGLKSYEALSERVMSRVDHHFVSMRQPIIRLEALNKERLSDVLLKVRDLYGNAYNWDARQFADDETISELLNDWTMSGDEVVDRKPRPVLREFIQMLDLCEENRGVSLAQFLKKDTVISPSYTSVN
ncbi:hypothetical protein GCM10027036_34760 [Flavihumibacter cheonanensis]|uniref:BREX system ATP-binding domain-containing protein n=1 Tax=Flavihumibacter cheonanensis TaxID=1442385 RepID=UPI001EF86F06|nr:BREX system ATP-binding domain-containing protein [Flavihumibacter cheonanensis]MCG7753480.1 DUF2791 family P-loop domain-containing protein [Flavihumibacter cheonanensis]